MKFCFSLLVALLFISTHSFGQWTNFDIYVTPGQWYQKSNDYFKANNFKNYLTLTQGGIVTSAANDTTFSAASIERYLVRKYPDVNSEGMLVLDWESEIFDYLRDLPETDPRFKYAENQFIALVNEIRRHRPRIKVGFYGMTFRGYNDWQKANYNRPGALDNIFANVDFIGPSLYIGYPDGERGREYNINFLKDNLDFAFAYGRRHNKPVIPFVWHRVIESDKLTSRAILQKEVYADYIKFISTYSNNGFKASGIFLWDDGSSNARLQDVAGLGNWLKDSVKDIATYDAMCVDMMKSIVSAINTK